MAADGAHSALNCLSDAQDHTAGSLEEVLKAGTGPGRLQWAVLSLWQRGKAARVSPAREGSSEVRLCCVARQVAFHLPPPASKLPSETLC